MKRVSKVELAYAAGIVDGEGCIRIGRKTHSGGLYIRITVNNTNRSLIIWLAERFSGSIGKTSKLNPHHKDSYRWTATHQQAKSFLLKIQPYLLLKQEQCQVALSFQNLVGVQGQHPISVRNVRKRESLVNKMHKLNKKGKQ